MWKLWFLFGRTLPIPDTVSICSEQLTVLLARIHSSTMILTNFENLNFLFLNLVFLLFLLDPGISICIYSITTDRDFLNQQSVSQPSSSKLLKCDLVQTLNAFQNSSILIFAAGKTSIVYVFLQIFTQFVSPICK